MAKSTPPTLPPIPSELADRIRDLHALVGQLERRIQTVEHMVKQLRHDWASAKTALNFLMDEVEAAAPVKKHAD